MKQFVATKYLDGLRHCVENVVELVEDADCLASKGRHARAYALLLIALEEIAKVNMLKSWAVDRWEHRALDKEELQFRKGIFTDHVGKLKRAAMGLYAAEEFKLKWGMTPGPPEADFLRLMRGMNKLHNAKNKSLYLHAGSASFEKPWNSSYEKECPRLKQWVLDLLKWVKGGTIYFLEHDVKWHLEVRQEPKEFHTSLVSLRAVLDRI